MFRISLKHKFVFFRIPKTASTSISTVLSEFEDKNLHFVLQQKLESKMNQLKLVSTSHVNQVILKPILDEIKAPIMDDFFEFVFVRHPYTRLASMYNSMKYPKSDLPPKHTIDELIDWCEERLDNSDNQKGKMIYNSQISWISHPLTDQVRFFKLEEADKSWNKIKEALNLDLPDLPVLNSSPQKSQKTDLTQAQQDRIYKVWRKEFDLLGYEP